MTGHPCSINSRIYVDIEKYCTQFVDKNYIDPIRYIPKVISKEENTIKLKREILSATAKATATIVGGVVIDGITYLYKQFFTSQINFEPVLKASTQKNEEYKKTIEKQYKQLLNITQKMVETQLYLSISHFSIISFLAAEIVTCASNQLN